MKQWLITVICFFFFSSLSASSNNAVIVCKNGLDMLDYDLEFIRHANKSIEISCCYSGGWVLKKLLAALDQRMKECPDLQVHFMTLATVFDEGDDKLIAQFQKGHPNFHAVIPVEDIVLLPNFGSTALHVKMVVVDEKYFSTGGSNMDEVMCCDGTFTQPRNKKRGWFVGDHIPSAQRDMDIVGSGDIAKEMRLYFYQLFALWQSYFNHRKFFFKTPESFKDQTAYFPVKEEDQPDVALFDNSPRKRSNIPIQMIVASPSPLKKSEIGLAYGELVRKAKEEIVIANLFFHPTSYILNPFMEASKRGVSITLVTNGSYDDSPYFGGLFGALNRVHYVPLIYGRSFHYYQALQAMKAKPNKVKIYEYHIPDVLYHKKVMVVDRKITIMGSYNLGIKSDQFDYEMDLILDSPEVAADFLEVINHDISLSEPISAYEARKWYFNPIVDLEAHGQSKLRGFY